MSINREQTEILPLMDLIGGALIWVQIGGGKEKSNIPIVFGQRFTEVLKFTLK